MARILIIDDDDILTALITERLHADGHEVRTMLDGETAAAVVSATRPDLVILDHHLPGTRGIDVLRAIRADETLEGVPVLMLTGERDGRLLERAHERGADDYLTKPVDLDELAHHAQAMLRGGQITRRAGVGG